MEVGVTKPFIFNLCSTFNPEILSNQVLDQKNISEITIRDTLDDAGIDVTDDVIEEGTPQDEVVKVGGMRWCNSND